ncbi:MAG TPA: LytTR family DNA-binding domain-containing protein [Chitinophagaceae bacterium]
MKSYNCLIVEDEPLAAEVLQDYIKQTPFLQLKGICPDALYAMEKLQNERIDLIFLDIHLPKLKGTEFLKTLKHPPQIIITSAYADYALQGYELNVLDYLLKPIEFSRFLMGVNKLRQFGESNSSSQVVVNSHGESPQLFINVNKKKVKVVLSDILYIESLREYIRITTRNNSLLTKFQLYEIEEMLTRNNFIRIHRSFIVAKDKIDAFSATEVEINGKQIPIGRSYKELVISILEKQ